MDIHKNARTCFYSRVQIVRRTEAGEEIRRVAQDLGVSERTVYKWKARYKSEGLQGLHDRSSRPRVMPCATQAATIQQVIRLRKQRRVAAEIAGLLNLARSTTARLIHRAGLGRLSVLEPREPVKRYEKSYAGELVHLDIKKLGRIDTPGHRVTGSRKNRRKPGWEFTHVAIDDYSRIGEAAFYPNETASSAVDFLLKVVKSFRHKGIQVQGILTDNGGCYCSKIFRKACQQLGIRHYRTRPYRPQTNGKAERFIQTLLREWAYRFVYSTSAERQSWLQPYLHFYNHHRMHQALKSLPPISRLPLNNLMRFHT